MEHYRLINFNGKVNSELIEFLNEVLKHPVNIKTWDWEFNRNKTIFHFYKSMNQIVATQSMLPIWLLFNGEEILTFKSETTYIRKDHRGKRIFENLYSNVVDDVWLNDGRLIWGFTPAVKAWKNNFHFDFNENAIYLIKVRFRMEENGNSIKKLLKTIFFNPMLVINRQSLKLSRTNIIIEELDDFIDFKEQNRDFLVNNEFLGIHLDNDYLNWRIKCNPFVNYKILKLVKDNQTIGFAIYSLCNNQVNITSMRLVNLSFAKSCLNIVCNFILENEKRITHISYWGNINNSFNDLIFTFFKRKIGYKLKRDVTRMLVYKFKNQNKIDSTNWLIDAMWTEGTNI